MGIVFQKFVREFLLEFFQRIDFVDHPFEGHGHAVGEIKGIFRHFDLPFMHIKNKSKYYSVIKSFCFACRS